MSSDMIKFGSIMIPNHKITIFSINQWLFALFAGSNEYHFRSYIKNISFEVNVIVSVHEIKFPKYWLSWFFIFWSSYFLTIEIRGLCWIKKIAVLNT